jgi:putative transposase
MEDPTQSTASLTGLSESVRQQALERYRLLVPYLTGGMPLSAIARQQGLPLRTLQRWVKQYREQGLLGLARRPRSDRNGRRFPSEIVKLVEGLALRKPPPTITWIHRQVVAFATQQGEPSPSYDWVYQVVRSLDPGLVTLAHDGVKAYSHAFDLVYRREADRPNAIWQADHTLLDLWLIGEKGEPARPWLTLILDDYSRAIAGYFLSFQNPSALQTALAFRQAIWRKEDPRWHVCGIPDTFYTDHGSDFTSRHLEQVSADLKIQLIFSTPGVPRGRGKIERFFDTVNQMLLCGLPGYAPAGTGPVTPSLALPEFDARFREFLLGEYHLRLHGTTGLPPQDRWEAGGFLPRMPDSLEQLDLLLLTVAKSRRIQRDGIHFQGLTYIDLTLAAYVGEEVTVRYDPRDMAEIRVFFRNRFLCRAICPEWAGTTIHLKELQKARRHRRLERGRQITERAAFVDSLLGIRPVGSASPDLSTVPDPLPPPPARSRLKRYFND